MLLFQIKREHHTEELNRTGQLPKHLLLQWQALDPSPFLSACVSSESESSWALFVKSVTKVYNLQLLAIAKNPQNYSASPLRLERLRNCEESSLVRSMLAARLFVALCCTLARGISSSFSSSSIWSRSCSSSFRPRSSLLEYITSNSSIQLLQIPMYLYLP